MPSDVGAGVCRGTSTRTSGKTPSISSPRVAAVPAKIPGSSDDRKSAQTSSTIFSACSDAAFDTSRSYASYRKCDVCVGSFRSWPRDMPMAARSSSLRCGAAPPAIASAAMVSRNERSPGASYGAVTPSDARSRLAREHASNAICRTLRGSRDDLCSDSSIVTVSDGSGLDDRTLIFDSDKIHTAAKSGACVCLDSTTSLSVVHSDSKEIPESAPYSPRVQQMTLANGTESILLASISSW
mmetsp:Transcript_13940/g.40013  ORF Transcript_13940/g.40013 Transcript_13940/m.40013 type:complete len:240 (-) Transcript_13940:1657-2376(-)